MSFGRRARNEIVVNDSSILMNKMLSQSGSSVLLSPPKHYEILSLVTDTRKELHYQLCHIPIHRFTESSLKIIKEDSQTVSMNNPTPAGRDKSGLRALSVNQNRVKRKIFIILLFSSEH